MVLSNARHPGEEVDDVLGFEMLDFTFLDIELGNPVSEDVAGLGVYAHRVLQVVLLPSNVVVIQGIGLGSWAATQLAGFHLTSNDALALKRFNASTGFG